MSYARTLENVARISAQTLLQELKSFAGDHGHKRTMA